MENSLKLSVSVDPVQALRTELVNGLRSGKWAPGSRLPTERSLCEDFGVSRSALRRVLKALRDEGLIVQRVGSGTYVAENTSVLTAPDQGKLGKFLAVPSVSPTQIMEARFLLEPMIVDLIVNNATMEDFERLEYCCDQSEAAETFEEFEHWDNALHEQMAHATRNALFISIFKLMAEVRNSEEWGFLKKKIVTEERRSLYQSDHRKIVEALKNRDADTARQALFDHLVHARINLLGRV